MGPLLARLGTSIVTWGVVGLLVVSAIAYNKFWSCAATLKRVEIKEARIEGRVVAEAEGLREDYKRLAAEPHQTGPELLAQLNESAKRLRGAK